jgi:hypothetical protein
MSPQPVSAASRRGVPLWLAIVLVVVALGAGVGAGALIWAGQVEKVYPPGVQALSPDKYDECVRGVTMSFSGEDPDPDMRAAAAKLRDDDRFDSVEEETRAEAYTRFKETFKDQPDLVDIARPEALPASLHLMVRKGSTAKDFQNALRAEFPGTELNIIDWCPPPE